MDDRSNTATVQADQQTQPAPDPASAGLAGTPQPVQNAPDASNLPASTTQNPGAPQVQPQAPPESGLHKLLSAAADLFSPSTHQELDSNNKMVDVKNTTGQRVQHGIGDALAIAGSALSGHNYGADLQKNDQAKTENLQNQQKINDEATLHKATIAYQNNQQLLAQREFDQKQGEVKAGYAKSAQEFALQAQQAGFQQVPIMVNGKDINGKAGNEADMMKYFSDAQAHKQPDGYSLMYVPTVDTDGKVSHTVYQVPVNQMNKPVTLTADQFQSVSGVPAPDNKPVTVPLSGMIALHSQHIESLTKQQQTATSKSEADKNEAEARKADRDATSGGGPVYAFDGKDTVLTTKADATSRNLVAIRPVKQADIAKDQHDIKVLNDIQVKSNNVSNAAKAMDQTSWSQAGIAASYMAEHTNTTVDNLIKSKELKNASPQTIAYIIAVNSLRESALGLQKVLTGSARSSESQIKALQSTLPGVEPNSDIVTKKLAAFDQNIGMLRQGLPTGTGIENTNSGAAPAGGGATHIYDPSTGTVKPITQGQ